MSYVASEAYEKLCSALQKDSLSKGIKMASSSLCCQPVCSKDVCLLIPRNAHQVHVVLTFVIFGEATKRREAMA